jgi:tripartite-type tricarboxylate transporter receptor subunit TctC
MMETNAMRNILFLALLVAGAVQAQERFPARPIELIVPTPPGGGVDIVARLLGSLAEPALGTKVVVYNKPGGGGALGVAQLTQAKPDGYTVAAVWNAPLTILPHTLSVPYAPDDYLPITQLTGGTPFVFCAKAEFPAKSGRELVDLLRANPGKYTYGNDGVAGSVQLAAERAFGKLGLRMRPVPFGGAGETVKNLLGGHVDVYGGTIPTILEFVRGGQVKCLVVTAPQRAATLPETASLGDLGIPETASELWRGIIAPKGVAAERAELVEKAFRQATQHPKFLEFEASRSEVAVGSSAADFARTIRAEYEANAEIIKRLGLGRKN